MSTNPNFARCSKIEGFISGYDVTVADQGDANTIRLVLVDPNNSMQNSESAKTILMKALDDYLAGASEDAVVYKSCPNCCERSQGSEGMTFFPGLKTLDFTAAGLGAVAGGSVLGNVPLPLKCEDVVTFA